MTREEHLVLTHLARCTHSPVQWGALLGLAKVRVVGVTAPQLFAGVKGPELEENALSLSGYPRLSQATQNATPSAQCYNLNWPVSMPMWVGAASAYVIWGHKDIVHAVWR